ncbi:hypothetical protein SAMN05443633_104441 [Chryseobacterium arachidis]|uniref:Crp/Fnr family transcriptional regulator n=1 Tax=Chryseobacterium arachidis TaxID=1416778 RepID=A0A1M5C8F5_9FLAO|nr:hypothetical protein [Chryseobacterium arachidis]SHF50936.1 hypothetical protein SAMN05443633_104441 [Chryseobacterium arachidis]
MIIPEEMLFNYGAELQKCTVDEFIFEENNVCRNYYQIQEGIIKLNNIFENGKEFVHGFPL